MRVRKTPTGEAVGPVLQSRYDWLLVTLPLPMLLGVAVAAAADVPAAFGVSAGGLPSAAMLLYALFVDPPLSD
ncbi:hypothetical protein NDI76_14065 [Halogeometricum sp. S1BR25-6]|uniref:Uncharacterized protein n=1 Tax=Halogeometricum salsisoli TaxID=2950536 RepID=A0ABU2GGF8_9EURY|nr:hypothetical protein [Halogeometricum sp. S1BR25-6]MDS0299870.1 hypothetical protein [Halogeometricum sp. S1BR25-6]